MNFRKLLRKKLDEVALGYERGLDFAWGMIQGWRDAKLINKKTYSELIDEFVKYDE